MIPVEQLRNMLSQVVQALEDAEVPVPTGLQNLNAEADILFGVCRSYGIGSLFEFCSDDFDDVDLANELIAALVGSIESRYYVEVAKRQATTIIRYAARVDPLEAELAGVKAVLDGFEASARLAQQKAACIEQSLFTMQQERDGAETALAIERAELTKSRGECQQALARVQTLDTMLQSTEALCVDLDNKLGDTQERLRMAEREREVPLLLVDDHSDGIVVTGRRRWGRKVLAVCCIILFATCFFSLAFL